jgi:hypothetical protein
MEVVSKVLPIMGLTLAILALSPVPLAYCGATGTCLQASAGPGGAEGSMEGMSGEEGPVGDSAGVYRAGLMLLLVWSLVDLARVTLRAVVRAVKPRVSRAATSPAAPCAAGGARERKAQRSVAGSCALLEGSARACPTLGQQVGAEGGGRIEDWLHAQHGSGRAGALSTVTPEPREEVIRTASDESVLHAAGNASLLARTLASKTVDPSLLTALFPPSIGPCPYVLSLLSPPLASFLVFRPFLPLDVYSEI